MFNQSLSSWWESPYFAPVAMFVGINIQARCAVTVTRENKQIRSSTSRTHNTEGSV